MKSSPNPCQIIKGRVVGVGVVVVVVVVMLLLIRDDDEGGRRDGRLYGIMAEDADAMRNNCKIPAVGRIMMALTAGTGEEEIQGK